MTKWQEEGEKEGHAVDAIVCVLKVEPFDNVTNIVARIASMRAFISVVFYCNKRNNNY